MQQHELAAICAFLYQLVSARVDVNGVGGGGQRKSKTNKLLTGQNIDTVCILTLSIGSGKGGWMTLKTEGRGKTQHLVTMETAG